MEQIEQDARKRHGGSQYALTWRARNEQNLSKKNLLWMLLALQVLMVYVVVLVIWYFGYLIIDNLIGVDGLAWLIGAIFIGSFIEGYLSPERSITAASSFYSIAADMKRTEQRELFPRFLFLFSAAMSVSLAMLVMLFYSRRLQKLSSTELDVLGSIFSKVGFWAFADRIYDVISMRYAQRHQGLFNNADNKQQIAISFALACKWAMASPKNSNNQKIFMSMIKGVMSEYPDLPKEVTVRLNESLTM